MYFPKLRDVFKMATSHSKTNIKYQNKINKFMLISTIFGIINTMEWLCARFGTTLTSKSKVTPSPFQKKIR